MKLCSYAVEGVSSFGAVTTSGEGVVDLGRRLPNAADLGAVLTQGRLGECAEIVTGADADHALEDIAFEQPIPHPGKIFCIGVNYGGRNAEYRDGSGEQARPSVFVRFPSSLTAHGGDLVRPPESEQLDYEGEIVAVIGKPGRRIATERARDHIAGLTLGNEGTIRDWVRHAKFNVTQGKNWESSGSVGPWMVTLDEIGAFDDLHLTTHVNGELRQDDTPRSMLFSIEFQVAYLSTFCTLQAGDMIFTGTPTGAGARFDPPRFLRPGDMVEVAVAEIGTLRNGVRDE
jgi:2-keto-4-pentenoate hydratase/2-oxohepta-3-ene-1,7-dioic acid hydratase in catechol pathway